MIRLEDLCKRFGPVVAVDALDLHVRPGEVFGFVGPNGAGKTTTLRMLAGLLRPTSGRVVVAGTDIAVDPVAVKERMGFIPDRPYIYEKLTGAEFLGFVAGLYGLEPARRHQRIPELLEQFAILDRADSLVETYSHGMKQRLVMCSALLHDPTVLVVDEPMVGLDPAGARLIKGIFRRLCADADRTVFLSTHSLEAAEELCDRIGIIHRGSLIALGTMAELRQRAGEDDGRLEDVFFRLTEEVSDVETERRAAG